MKSRILIAFFVLGNSLYLCGAANSDKLSPRDAMQLFTQITGTFNVNKSIAKGAAKTELPALKQRIKNAKTILLGKATKMNSHKKSFRDICNKKSFRDIFKQQTLAPLQRAFEFVNKKVSDYHQLYQTLIQKEDTEWNAKQLLSLAKLFENKPEMSTKLYNQIVKAGDTATLAAMAEFRKKTDDDKNKAIILAVKSPKSRYMIPETYRLRLLVNLIEQDINDPSQFDFQRTALGRIIKGISSKVRETSATYPEAWTNTIPVKTFTFNDQALSSIYKAFQNTYTQKNELTRKDDLKEIFNKHKAFDEDSIKPFISLLEKYQYHLENYRPVNWNISWAFTRLGDTMQYAQHLKITKKLLQHLRELYPSIMSDLDDQLQLHGKYTPTDQFILMQALGYDAILLGVIKEVRELKRQYIEKETQSSSKETQSSSWGVL